MPAGSGRTLFFGIEETWRWRYRDGQPKFDEFWRRTLDYLALRPHRRTELVLDKRTAYRQGDEIKVTVSLADEVRVAAGSRPVIARATFLPLERKDPEFITIPLQDVAGALRRGTIKNAQPGHYRIRLTEPDVVVLKLGREIPTATADVVALPKEAERAPMNVSELAHAADVANGAFFAVTSADEFLRHWPRQKKTP
jgi:hypothetical protein